MHQIKFLPDLYFEKYTASKENLTTERSDVHVEYKE